MKRAFLIIVGVLVLASGVSTVQGKEAAKSEPLTLTGTIIDNMCAGINKADLQNFIKRHTKECALKPPCAASGYSLFHYGSLIPFDSESNKRIEQFLKEKDSTLAVSVTIKKAGDKYSVISIKSL